MHAMRLTGAMPDPTMRPMSEALPSRLRSSHVQMALNTNPEV